MTKRASDSWIAISVIACSIVLFVALAIGLSGRALIREGHYVRVRFHDITGIKVSSQVKFAGAPAGLVSGARMLTAAERASDPGNLVEVTLNLFKDVPPLTKNARVSIAADTLLSDKFVQLQDEGGAAPPLAEGEILVGTSPTTFDKLAKNVDDAIEGLRKTMGGDAGDHAKDLFTKIDLVVDEAREILDGLKPVLKDLGVAMADAKTTMADAKAAMADTRSLIADNKPGITQAVARVDSAAGSMESLAKKGEALVQDNSKNLTAAVSGFRVTSDNLKVTSTYAKFLIKDFSERPARLIWGGGRPPAFPSHQEILNSRQPLPDR